VLELRVSVRVPSGSTVYFPDKLPTTPAIESHGAVRWAAEPAPGGATLKLSYPLLALGIGRIVVPGLEILAGPAGSAKGGAALPGGSGIGAWGDAPAGSATLLARIPPREVRSKSLFELEGVLGGVGPTPAADVVGPNWSTAALALWAASGVTVLGLAATLLLPLRKRRSGRAPQERRTPVEAGRLAALKELDELLALDLHGEGRLREFYERTSRIVRRYVERFDPAWGPNLTSTELMHSLAARVPAEPPESLRAEMNSAEFVKFGPTRLEADAAVVHWREVRGWIENSRDAGS
jgi:hypothetical protein